MSKWNMPLPSACATGQSLNLTRFGMSSRFESNSRAWVQFKPGKGLRAPNNRRPIRDATRTSRCSGNPYCTTRARLEAQPECSTLSEINATTQQYSSRASARQVHAASRCQQGCRITLIHFLFQRPSVCSWCRFKHSRSRPRADETIKKANNTREKNRSEYTAVGGSGS